MSSELPGAAWQRILPRGPSTPRPSSSFLRQCRRAPLGMTGLWIVIMPTISDDTYRATNEGRHRRVVAVSTSLRLRLLSRKQKLFRPKIPHCIPELGCLFKFEFLGGLAHVALQFGDVVIQLFLRFEIR